MQSGKYEVRMLGWMKWFPPNYKQIKGNRGVNLLLGHTRWGHFIIRDRFRNDLLLDYDVSGNSALTRRIRDYVKEMGPGRYVGKFCYVLCGKPRFLALFTFKKEVDG